MKNSTCVICVIKFYYILQKSRILQDNIMNELILVGDKGVGKTMLLECNSNNSLMLLY